MVRERTGDDRHSLGRWGEAVARRYLEEQGYTIRDKNYRCSSGEMDIVAQKNRTLVFVEVKTRRSTSLGEPVEAVSPGKVKKLREIAGRYLAETPIRYGDVRFDVISIMVEGEAPELTHLKAAF